MQSGTFQMKDGYVLNTYTGDLWRIDDQKRVCRLIQREEPVLTMIEKAILYLNLADRLDKAELDRQKDETLEEITEHEMLTEQSQANALRQRMQNLLDIVKEMDKIHKDTVESMS
jgi:hypothetical protein